MARIAQKELALEWDVIDEEPDLVRIHMLLENANDEELMRKLESDRKGRRDDYPVRVCWNTTLAGMVIGHRSTAETLRELRRNPALRKVVGIAVAAGADGVPTKDAMSRFSKKLLRHQREVEEIKRRMLVELRVLLPDLGKDTAVDSTAIRTWARGRRDPSKSTDPEAGWGMKVRRWKGKDGVMHEDVTKWFGYKGHLLVDTKHELPLDRTVTAANEADVKELSPLVEQFHEKHPEIKIKTLSADKAYDDGEEVRKLYEEHGIKAVIAIRDSAQDGEDGERLSPGSNVLLGDDGTVYCYHKEGAAIVRQAMVCWGWEKSRGTLKWRCPAAVSGLACPERETCSPTPYGRTVRVHAEQDWRRFGPVAHGTKKRKRLYNGRTAAERVNSRIKGGLRLDELTVRGKKKITLKLDLAIIVLYSLALGHLRRKAKHWRSYTRVAD
ncbi:MAG: transposase [Planctomycetes bacterium]|nr:transposase [Planctomycetota bacterium]